jgi:hypothetical protein
LRIAESNRSAKSASTRGEDNNRFAVVREALADALGADESGDVLEMRYEVESTSR